MVFGLVSGGASGLAGAGGAAAAAGIPFGPIFMVASVAYTLLSRPSPVDSRKPGDAFRVGLNPDDPNTPIGFPYGYGPFLMTRLMRFSNPAKRDAERFSEPAPRVTVLSCGHSGDGGIDGGDFKLWRNDQQQFDTVDASDSLAARKLTPVDTKGRFFEFPNRWVQPTTVVLYKDGVKVGVGGNTPGVVGEGDNDFTVVSNKRAAAIEITNPANSAFFSRARIDDDSGSRRHGFLLPVEGRIVPGSMTVVAHLRRVKQQVQASTFVKTRDGVGSNKAVYNVPAEDISFGTLNGFPTTQYVWIDWVRVTARSSDTSYADGNLSLVSHYIVTYRVEETVNPKFEIRIDKTDGKSRIEFFEDQSAFTWTATYKHANSDNFTWTFRDGSENQEPLPIDALRNTFVLGTELVVGSAVVYSTSNKVHDVVIGLHTGPEGFYNLNSSEGDYRVAVRTYQIRIKESDAPDAPTAGVDLSKGWATVKNKRTGKPEFKIIDAILGVGKLFVSVSEQFLPGNGPAFLPYKRYDVEVTTLDADGIDTYFGNVINTDRVKTRLFFGDATEVVKHKLRLAGHATLTIVEDDPQGFEQEGVWAVAFKGRRCWVPDAGATRNADTGRPEPGQYKWTRNPVHIAVDLIRQERHSVGEFYGWLDIDITTWLSAAAFCDDQVTNGDGTLETRSEFDHFIQDSDNVDAIVEFILAGSQVLPIQSGGVWKFVKDVDIAANPFTLEDATDLRIKEIKLKKASPEEISDILDVEYTPEELDGETDHHKVRLEEPEPAQPRTRFVDWRGVRRLSQVMRVGVQFLLAIQRNTLGVEMVAAGWRTLQIEAGDIQPLTSARIGLTGSLAGKLFRVVRTDYGGALDMVLELAEHDPTVYDEAERINRAPPATQVAPAAVESTNIASIVTPVVSTLAAKHISGDRVLLEFGAIRGSNS